MRSKFLLIVAAVMLLPSSVFAGGLFWPGVGAVGLAQGDAAGLTVQNATSLAYNPAQLLGSNGLEISLGGTASHLSLTVNRSSDFLHTAPIDAFGRCTFGEKQDDGTCPIPENLPDELATNYREVQNSSSGFAQPVVGAVYDVDGVLNNSLRIALLWYGVNRPQIGFQKDSPPRYVAYEQSFQDQTVALGAAYGLFKNRLRLGAAVQFHVLWFRRAWITNFTDLRTQCRAWACPKDNPDCNCQTNYIYYDTSMDARTIFEAYGFAVSANFGVSGNPFAHLWLGASVQTPYSFNSTGDLWVEVPVGLSRREGVKFVGSDADLKIDFPLMARFAAAWLDKRFGVEANLVFENWSRLDHFEIIPKNYKLVLEPLSDDDERTEVNLFEIRHPLASDDSLMGNVLRFSLGGYIDIVGNNTFVPRCGFFYENQTVATPMISTAYYDSDKLGFSAGASFEESWFGASFSYTYIQYLDRTVSNGRVYVYHPQAGFSGYTDPQEVPASANNPPIIANNGKYSGSAWLISLELTFKPF